jgi:hypothetical protein
MRPNRVLTRAGQLIVAVLVLAHFTIFWADEAVGQSAQSITLNATFNGNYYGIIGSTYYLPPGSNSSNCDPSVYTCVFQLLSGPATVTGQVDIEPVTGQQNSVNISQNYMVTSPVGSFTLSQQANGDPFSNCQDTFRDTVVCIDDTVGFGGSDQKGESVILSPYYGDSPLDATTLPITYPGNFTSDFLTLGSPGVPTSPTGGAYFYSGNLGDSQNAFFCSLIGGALIQNAGVTQCVVGSVTGSASTNEVCTAMNVNPFPASGPAPTVDVILAGPPMNVKPTAIANYMRASAQSTQAGQTIKQAATECGGFNFD